MNADFFDAIVFAVSFVLVGLIYLLAKKIFFKKTEWSLQSVRGILGFALLVFQTGTLFQHYFLNRSLLRNPESFIVPTDFLEVILRILGIFIIPSGAKFVYMIKRFRTTWRRKLARIILFLSPIFLMYLSFGSLVKQVPSNSNNYIYIWVASLLADLFLAFFSPQWPVFKPNFVNYQVNGWFKGLKIFFRKSQNFYFKSRVIGKYVLPVILCIGYVSIMYSKEAPEKIWGEQKTYHIVDERGKIKKNLTKEQYDEYCYLIQTNNPGPFGACLIRFVVSVPFAPLAAVFKPPPRYLQVRTRQINQVCPHCVF